MAADDLRAPENYLNRELSWLSFDERVLAMARRRSIPLAERLKFVAIASSNLDEFYMVRVGGLEREARQATPNFDPGPDGLLLPELLEACHQKARALADLIGQVLNQEILPELRAHGVLLRTRDEMDDAALDRVRRYYEREVHPTLTPIALDPCHPFPVLRSGALNIALRVESDPKTPNAGILGPSESHRFAIVQVPSVLPRFPRFASEEAPYTYVALEDIIIQNVEDLFPGHRVLEAATFRVTRASDLDIAEDEAEDLLSTIQDVLRRRDRGEPVRLEVHAEASDTLVQYLLERLDLEPRHLHRTRGLLAAAATMKVYGDLQIPELRDPSFTPVLAAPLRYSPSLFRSIAERDILLHHPYESFRHVVDFIDQAASDPDVVAIKQTLYRTSGDSPIVRALLRAAEMGKDVTALVELKARFDEANNIAWAQRLEESGVHVVYGLIGLKIHGKILLVTRREGDELERYLHLGTGNYNPSTARLYTDMGLLTARKDITHDAMLLFNVLTGYAELPEMKQLVVAPFNLRQHILDRIQAEIRHAEAGRPAGLVAKMNSLVDGEVIEWLYRANRAGVSIDLIVRGICCLRPGVSGLSENIRVRSILDRFLEHSRVFWWRNGGEDLVYLSSADWMPRNLNRRIECCFPILDPELASRIKDEILTVELADNCSAWELGPDAQYTLLSPPPESDILRTQQTFIERANEAARRHRSEGPSARANTPAISPVMRLLQAQRRRHSEQT